MATVLQGYDNALMLHPPPPPAYHPPPYAPGYEYANRPYNLDRPQVDTSQTPSGHIAPGWGLHPRYLQPQAFQTGDRAIDRPEDVTNGGSLNFTNSAPEMEEAPPPSYDEIMRLSNEHKY